jgi:hypothetical protein
LNDARPPDDETAPDPSRQRTLGYRAGDEPQPARARNDTVRGIVSILSLAIAITVAALVIVWFIAVPIVRLFRWG